MVDVAAALFDLAQRRSLLPGAVENVVSGPGRDVSGLAVLVTGASEGIGREAVRALTARGAHLVAVARRSDELRLLASETGCDHIVADLSDEAGVAALLDELGDARIDVLVNNAGRSIRRSILDSTERLHDYQRTMSLNYFAAVQLSLGLLPGMVERGSGQIVNICTWGLMAGTFPRFSAYAASKNALGIFGRSLNAERPHPGVCATNVYYPLVRTEMIAPTAEYDDLHALDVTEAANWIVRAITHQPEEVAPAALRAVLPVLDYLSPAVADRAMRALT
ncbi:SDR family NAD(P)-dependent oxidoreductase [Gordonia sp. L191]|uniref:SDR family NAD(P)-dependent oxidoreductase n=1 Tax=Gordonia sp. L191 TaxID=2982699 RepID=UPI0024C0449A|nr:SDR family NAD(P)-dependent oxidoreductase [Gordonia sp. L191]WHU48090.1 SDR family NAD(P)-dependent oxidoreductase [Gordonia sp. L191]